MPQPLQNSASLLGGYEHLRQLGARGCGSFSRIVLRIASILEAFVLLAVIRIQTRKSAGSMAILRFSNGLQAQRGYAWHLHLKNKT